MKKLACILVGSLTLFLYSCEKDAGNSASASSEVGKGGSLAKFTIVGNYIYAVSMHYLYTVDISNPTAPVKVNQSLLSFDMETIYPYKNRLYIGSRTGLYIYSIDTASSPRLIGEAKHGRSCDPVVANDTVSYSTLKGNSFCGPATSGLYVHDVKNINNPVLKKTIPINEPIGLGIADSALYVCAAGEGLKVFKINNAYDPVINSTIPGNYFIDVIPYNDMLICWTRDGIRLYDISNRLNPQFIKLIAN
ncbi:MAG TPA: hypothetical protein PKG90_05875 [Chitinophagaceae bacterium]|nr:hypothetical protein [Chitinophagaceae bacterium]HNU15852.1 hypothetical protein [Chitinophagaceae bacterium]